MRRGCRSLAALVAVGTLVLVLAGTIATASAHPLGNFTVNRYAEVEVSSGVVRISYVLDLAEIPAFQARNELASDREGWADRQIAAIARDLVLEVDGDALALRPLDRRLSQPDGDGGLSTVRLSVLFEAALPSSEPETVRAARLVDGNDSNRIGWREIVVVAAGDASVVTADVPADDVSDALRVYPEDRLASPLDVRSTTFRFTPGSQPVAAGAIVEAAGERRVADRFTGLLDRQGLTPIVLAGMLGIAVLVGVGHALAPGHGKTVMAAYLIGTRGRPVDAVLLGVIVSAMHTTSVLLLGVALYQVDQSFALDRIYPILTLVSGAGVLLVGAWLASTRVRSLSSGQTGPAHHAEPADGGNSAHHDHVHQVGRHVGHEHGDVAHRSDSGGSTLVVEHAPVATLVRDHDHHQVAGGHDHDHGGHDHGENDHGHHHGPGGHSHELPEGVPPLSKRGLLLLATAGGVVPSPSAVIVLVSAFTLGRVGLGLALVAAFSVGLAATLTAVGLMLVFGSRALGDRVSHRVVRVFPVLGAAALLVLGLVLTVQGVAGL